MLCWTHIHSSILEARFVKTPVIRVFSLLILPPSFVLYKVISFIMIITIMLVIISCSSTSVAAAASSPWESSASLLSSCLPLSSSSLSWLMLLAFHVLIACCACVRMYWPRMGLIWIHIHGWRRRHHYSHRYHRHHHCPSHRYIVLLLCACFALLFKTEFCVSCSLWLKTYITGQGRALTGLIFVAVEVICHHHYHHYHRRLLSPGRLCAPCHSVSLIVIFKYLWST